MKNVSVVSGREKFSDGARHAPTERSGASALSGGDDGIHAAPDPGSRPETSRMGFV